MPTSVAKRSSSSRRGDYGDRQQKKKKAPRSGRGRRRKRQQPANVSRDEDHEKSKEETSSGNASSCASHSNTGPVLGPAVTPCRDGADVGDFSMIRTHSAVRDTPLFAEALGVNSPLLDAVESGFDCFVWNVDAPRTTPRSPVDLASWGSSSTAALIGAAFVESCDNDSLASLPRALWRHVLGFLNACDLAAAARTCRFLRDLAGLPEVWHDVCQRDFARFFRNGVLPPADTQARWRSVYYRLRALESTEGTRVAFERRDLGENADGVSADSGEDDSAWSSGDESDELLSPLVEPTNMSSPEARRRTSSSIARRGRLVPGQCVACPICCVRLGPTTPGNSASSKGRFECRRDGFAMWLVSCSSCRRVPDLTSEPSRCVAPDCATGDAWPLCAACVRACVHCERLFCADCLPCGGAFPCSFCSGTWAATGACPPSAQEEISVQHAGFSLLGKRPASACLEHDGADSESGDSDGDGDIAASDDEDDDVTFGPSFEVSAAGGALDRPQPVWDSNMLHGSLDLAKWMQNSISSSSSESERSSVDSVASSSSLRPPSVDLTLAPSISPHTPTNPLQYP